MKEKHILAHMRTAFNYAECSSAVRLKVGAILVKDDRIISIGYNGQPAGWDNVCEDKIYDKGAGGWLSPEEFYEQYPYEEFDHENNVTRRYSLKTKPTVLHAESNAIAKIARSSESSEGSSLFVTHNPCLPCATQIYQAGIKEVFYANTYRSDDGIEFLLKCNIPVIKLDV